MKRAWKAKNIFLVWFTLAAIILGTLTTETWAKPAPTAPKATVKGYSLTADVPLECVNLDKAIRKATPLSTVLDAKKNAVIGPSTANGVYVDSKTPHQIGRIDILPGGTLYVPDSPLELKVRTIVVEGTFQVGTQACPIGTLNAANKVILEFVGQRPLSVDRTQDQCMNPGVFHKGIQVAAGGILRLYGAKGVPLYDANGALKPESGVSWTHLSKPAGPGFDPNFASFTPNTKQYFTESDNASQPTGVKAPVSADDIKANNQTLHLADDVTQADRPWQIGDWIVVGTTSFSPYESEFVEIVDVPKKEPTGPGSYVVIGGGLRHYHFGGLDPGPPSDKNYDDDNNTNFGVDERAEVGLISRNIKLSAEVSGVQDHWGGEIQVCPGFAKARIEGVEVEKFGKDKLGSYPLHFHMLGDVQGKATVKANSIHHSYNKCITVHSTSNLEVHDTVCARIVGHIFYEERGDEQNTLFKNNLGLGALSNDFDVHKLDGTFPTLDGKDQVHLVYDFKKLWWDGDKLAATADFNYDGLNIPNDGNFTSPVHGFCKKPNVTNPNVVFNYQGKQVFLPQSLGLVNAVPALPNPVNGCTDPAPGTRYYEAASGFWITNPTTRLVGNSIGGCQGMGVGFWYLNPGGGPNKFTPIGHFKNNRAHACYYGFYDENSQGVTSDQLFPRKQVQVGNNIVERPVITTFDGVTATRNRYLGFWMRPEWIVVKNARFASNRDAISLVTSGGLDGNAPGVWSLLEDSVVIGRSQNNVDLFGPCPYNNQAGPFTGELFGCIDVNSLAGSYDQYENGYPQVYWNWGGYYIYDGPVRIFRNRFVNFKQDITGLLTDYDLQLLNEKVKHLVNGSGVHEGDAALSWFKSNQSAYPNATASRELSFKNVDLRHQIFTEAVNFGDFADGDKNTVILDRDGSLSGLMVTDVNLKPVKGQYPISLNNLTFNGTANSIDECHSMGRQDAVLEGRPTSLITSGAIATLEFEAQNSFTEYKDPTDNSTKNQNHKQNIEFTIDSAQYKDQNGNPVFPQPEDRVMSLKGRDNKQVWEPKVTSGYGYTILVKPAAQLPQTGIPKVINVGLTDAVKENMKKNPFYVRVGICYTSKGGSHPQNPGDFTIKRGYKSWGQLTNFNYKASNDKPLKRLYVELKEDLYQNQTCHNLDFQTNANLDPTNGCPANGVTIPADNGTCPSGSSPTTYNGSNLCIFSKQTLTAAASLGGLKDSTGKPALDKYFYDSNTGMLFFYLVQNYDNPEAPSPLGSCLGGVIDPSCPKFHQGESYYACPPQGCIEYNVRLNDASYDAGESLCDISGYEPEVPNPFTLHWLATMNLTDGKPEQIVNVETKESTEGYWHREAAAGTQPSCEDDQTWQRK